MSANRSHAGRILGLAFGFLVLLPSVSLADRFCDSSYEDCRTPLLDLIRNEQVGIDVAFWFMEDTRYATELIRRWQAGVPVRVAMDPRAVTQYGYTNAAPALAMMKDAGIPMRQKTATGILHFKTMIFAGQNVTEFSAANYSSEAFVPIQPFVNYVDEIIYFSDTPSIVNSFKTRFDDVWTDTAAFADYANVSGTPVRRYPQYAIAPELTFVPWESFRSRAVARYRAEPTGIDSIMYRITDRAHSDAMIAAVQRGVAVRLISEPAEYRTASRLWHAWNIDRMYAAGVHIRHRAHAGLLHEKLTILNGTGWTIFGSSNWTSASTSSQHEHNLFTTDPVFFQWSRDHFDRKWTNRAGYTETEPFVPLPPDTPFLIAPSDGAPDQPSSVTLKWYAGPWAHKYDVYIGASPSSLTKVLSDRELGPSTSKTDYIEWTVSGLSPGTTYYWQVITRTMANVERYSAMRTFRTQGTASDTVTVAATPSTGSGSGHTFTLQYADTLGATQVATAWVWFNASFSSRAANSCMAYLSVAANTVYLLDDAGKAWQPGTLGSATTLQNSQCALALGSSTRTMSGTTLTLNLAVTFTPRFAGAKNIYVYGASTSGANSGWQDRGDWTVASAAAVTADSVVPGGGSGTSQTFVLRYSDAGGASNLATAWVWFNHAFTASGASTCMAYYNRGTNTVFLLNDAGTAWQTGTPGSPMTLRNSQCEIALSGSRVQLQGNTLIVTLAATFRPAWAGAKNIYLYSANRQGVASGWVDRGDWNVPAAGAVVSSIGVNPGSGSGSSQQFVLTYGNSAGAADFATAWVWFNPTFTSQAARSCMAYFSPATWTLYLLNDAGTTWQGAQLGAATTLGNSQCAIAMSQSGAAFTGTTLTVSLALTFHPEYRGAKNIYTYASSKTGTNTGWEDRGGWLVQ